MWIEMNWMLPAVCQQNGKISFRIIKRRKIRKKIYFRSQMQIEAAWKDLLPATNANEAAGKDLFLVVSIGLMQCARGKIYFRLDVYGLNESISWAAGWSWACCWRPSDGWELASRGRTEPPPWGTHHPRLSVENIST